MTEFVERDVPLRKAKLYTLPDGPKEHYFYYVKRGPIQTPRRGDLFYPKQFFPLQVWKRPNQRGRVSAARSKSVKGTLAYKLPYDIPWDKRFFYYVDGTGSVYRTPRANATR